MSGGKMITVGEAAVAREKERVSFFGVVVETTFPRPSKGTDWYCTMKVVDPSCSEGFNVNVFTEECRQPHLRSLGDIVRFREVVANIYKEGKVNAVFYKDSSEFSLYPKDDGFDPYQTFAKRRFVGKDDSETIANLRAWFANFTYGADLPITLSSLRGIMEEAYLGVKVLHKYPDSQGRYIALVWDGTDCPSDVIDSTRQDLSESLPSDVLRTFPTLGTIFRVIIDQGIRVHAHRLLKPGEWVKIYNLRINIQSGLFYGILPPNVRLKYTSPSDLCVLERERLCRPRRES
ncbi:Protection of telomeres protein 1b [Linum perenne]